MSGAIPWSVKGIDPRAREAAREAARRQGLTIGEWLNQAILANEAALAQARGEPLVQDGGGQGLGDALRQLAERMDVDDRRNALSLAGMDRTLSAVAGRVERAEIEARAENGRVADLLEELRDAQSVLLEQMQRIEEEDLPALRAEAGASDQIDAIKGDLLLLSDKAIAAERATGRALADLTGAMTALDAKVVEATNPERADAQAAALRQSFEAGLDTMAQDVAAMIAETRADIAGQIVAALGGLQPEEMNEALADMSRRLATAERRHTQTIEAVSIEIKRLSENMDRRLRVVEARNDEGAAQELREEIASMSQSVEHRLSEMETREAAAFSRMGDEVGRIAERLDVRVSNSEARSASAIDQVGEQVALMAERLSAKQDKFAADITTRLVQTEERQSGRLSQALATISERLGAIETGANERLNPVSQAMDSFAARLKVIESQTGVLVTLPEIEPPLAPAYLDAPILDPEPAATPRAFGLEHEADLHARYTREPEAPAPLTPEEPREHIYLEDIEEEFARRDEDSEYAPKFQAPPERPGQRNLDDPFADIEDSPPEDDEEDLFWSTGKPEDHPHEAPQARPEPYRLPRGYDEDTPTGDEEENELGADGEYDEPLGDTRALIEEQDIERDVFGADSEPLSIPVKEDYLAAARRAAQASATTSKSHARKETPTPAAGLRGVSRVILWGAAGALAAALAGGVYAFSAQREAPREPHPRKDASLLPAPPGSIAEGAALAAAAQQPETPVSLGPAGAAADTPTRAGPLDAGPSAQANTVQPVSAIALTIDAAAARGNPIAQYEVGIARLASGDDVTAVSMLQRAADQGLAMAQYRLAKLYERGEGVALNLQAARQWTERAAVAGNRKAMHDLGVYYARGEGAPFDEAAAFKWFRQAAEYGVANSQFNLGVLYSQGRGVAPDTGEALYWFSIAATSGDADARARAAMIEQQMSASAAAAVKARVKAFRAKPAIARANGEFGAQPWAPAASLQASADASPRT